MKTSDIITVKGRELTAVIHVDGGRLKLFCIQETRQNKKSFRALMKIREKLVTALQPSLHAENP